MKESVEFITCPTCGIENTMPFLGISDIAHCRQCDLIYVNPRRLRKETEDFFEQRYIPNDLMLRQEFGDWRRESLCRESELIKRLKEPGRILDVGCAGGEFLMYFLNSGWECSGIEPSMVASEEAKRRGIHIYGGSLKDAEMPEKYFDAIVFLDMLYFDPSPLEDLAKACRALKNDGVLIIELPGHTYRILRKFGPLSLILNRRWNDFSSASPHLFYFSTPGLRRLLEKADIRIVTMVPEMAPLRGSAILKIINRVHFEFSRFLFAITLGKINIAAKVVYQCRKM